MRDTPAPVVENGQTVSLGTASTSPVVTPQSSDQGTAVVTPLARPQTVAMQAQPNRAVYGLRKNAERQRNQGNYKAAAATLERALRISPRDALLWNRLATVRIELREYDQVENLAAKSNALAGNNLSLQADNWRLIARARHAMGDVSGARSASTKANRLVQ